MLKYAACLELGRGVQKDEPAALLAYERAAAHGSAVAQNNIGQMILDGRGVQEDPMFAAKWFRCFPCFTYLLNCEIVFCSFMFGELHVGSVRSGARMHTREEGFKLELHEYFIEYR
jgi:hypothetical protein